MEILRARPSDAEALTWISFAAKRYWGYPERWIERWRETLTISPEFIRRNETYAAVVEGKPVGFYTLVGEGREITLEHLWVVPECIGAGIGRTLFDHAIRRAASLEHFSRQLIGQSVTTVCKPAQNVPTTDRIECLTYGFHQSLLRASLDAA